jgi:hypothetical protein
MARYLEVTCVMYFQPVDLMKIYEINIIGWWSHYFGTWSHQIGIS